MLTAKIIYPFGATFLDYPDNKSNAVIIYFLGCELHCINCHNQLFQIRDNEKAKEVTIKQFYDDLFSACDRNRTSKVVFSGGDSLSPLNRDFTREFLNKYGNVFDIFIYTGYRVEQVKMLNIKGFKFIKTGQYDENLKQESNQSDNFMKLASSNQEIYNENYSLLTRNGVLNF
jgi:organic radical activating enzyme